MASSEELYIQLDRQLKNVDNLTERARTKTLHKLVEYKIGNCWTQRLIGRWNTVSKLAVRGRRREAD